MHDDALASVAALIGDPARYFRLADDDVGEMLEGLMAVATRPSRGRSGPSDPALRVARVCYDHIAGRAGARSKRCSTSASAKTSRIVPWPSVFFAPSPAFPVPAAESPAA